ncbi:MAG: hypothetical protein QOH15_3139 [Gaiellales bacterium]|jgi:hypothetical protein|nr:hypothetical protein [Gaiellales bacterium]
MKRRLRTLALLAVSLCALVVLASPAAAAEIVDRNVTGPHLSVNAKGDVALVTYTLKGARHHVLYWGARNWAGKFLRDYSGGWKSKVADWKAFPNNCKPYTGPAIALVVAACDAPDGSHWALQTWARLWNNYGGSSAPAELYISHWTGDIGDLTVQTDWGYHGKHEHLWGSFQFHGKPVFGNKQTLQGVPLDSAGRNVYVDYAADGSWKRENSFLTHKGTGGFCYLFGTQGGRSSAVRAPTYRATVIGPGVSPLVRADFAPPPPFSPQTDAQANALQRAAYGQDDRRRCVIN